MNFISLPLLLFFFNSVAPGTVPHSRCPNGFTLLNDGACVQFFSTPKLYQDALDSCKTFTGGNLVAIHNAIDNRKLANLVTTQGYAKPVWLGLLCSHTDLLMPLCSWTDGSGFTSYNNFIQLFPDLDIGVNVYMINSGQSIGVWTSANGTTEALAYICEVPTDRRINMCLNEFNGNCYTINYNTPYVNETGAREYCQQQCGDLVSIHSDKENSHVNNLFYPASYWTRALIGARAENSWSDGTDFDYCNFRYINQEIGNCSFMALLSKYADDGQWMSYPCDQKTPFICKWAKNLTSCSSETKTNANKSSAMCGPNPTEPSNNRNMCDQAIFYTGNGTIFSPYYPDRFTKTIYSNDCIYVITTPIGSFARIQFSNDTFFDGCTMELYSQMLNGVYEGEPFASFTQYPPKTPITSTTNVMKMIFTRVLDTSPRYVVHYESV